MGYCVKNYEVKINLMFLEIRVDYDKIRNVKYCEYIPDVLLLS